MHDLAIHRVLKVSSTALSGAAVCQNDDNYQSPNKESPLNTSALIVMKLTRCQSEIYISVHCQIMPLSRYKYQLTSL